MIVVFEGRDAAGKGGTIRALTERVSPRVFRVIALPAPSDREKSQMYIQRYMQHFPGAGEIVIFDRSWYNRAGVEYVMGFCTEEEHRRFLTLCPVVEKYIVDAGIILIKYWMEVGKKEQQRRFEARIKDPMRQWKLSPMDLESFRRWYQFSRARDLMLECHRHRACALASRKRCSDDKRTARLNCISHLLTLIPHKKIRRDKVRLPKRKSNGSYDGSGQFGGKAFCWGEVSRHAGGSHWVGRTPKSVSTFGFSSRTDRRV